MTFNLHSATASEAKDYVLANLSDGVRCPCCEQYARIYRRKLNNAMARLLIWLVRHYQEENRWYSIHEFPLIQGRRGGGDFAKLSYWGLAISFDQECEILDHPGDEQHSGKWRPELKGVDFVRNTILVPEYAYVYNGRLLGFSDDHVDIMTCLGTSFSYEELMNG